jgi:K+-transporting ATPase ATPase B chain
LWNWQLDVAQRLSIDGATLIKFTAETRTSGVVLKKDGTNIRKGQDAAKYCTSIRKYFPEIQLKK